MDYNRLGQDIVATGTQVGFKVIGAIVLWFVGSWLIRFAVNNLIIRSMRGKGVDHTIIAYVSNAVTILLKITLVVAILGYFGIQTTTFAALRQRLVCQSGPHGVGSCPISRQGHSL